MRILSSVFNILSQASYGLPCGSDGKKSACNAGEARNAGLIPGSGRSPGVGNGNPLQYSCLENSMDRGAWWATAPGVTKSWKELSPYDRPTKEVGGHVKVLGLDLTDI